ncbi:radical SAM/SPASM domain-containing protein [Bacteroidia bacterium]|nr:radical SAM/SPASM domain-containing protein [Bacteroidia bacterium]
MEDYRFSSYGIKVKLENEEDKYMLLHGYTGAIDIVNEKVMEYLDNISHYQEKNKQLSESTLKSLEKRGYLTTKTIDEEVLFVKKMANLMHRKAKLTHINFGLLVSYDCNFRCPYCYEAKISNYGSRWSKQKFTKELVDKAYSAMVQIQERREFHSKAILLYGGEPLLKENKDIVTYIVKKGNELGYHFFAITNGYDIEEYADLLGPKMIERIQITVDGWKPYHNKKRIHYKNGETFDTIIKNVGIALKKDIYVGIRMNTDINNFDGIEQLSQYFNQIGFSKFEKFNFNSALLVDYLQSGSNKKVNYMNRTEFCDRHGKLNVEQKFEDWGCSQNLTNAIKKGKKLNLSPVYCAAQVGSYIFDPFGKIYSCWESIGKQEALVGDYNEEEIQWTSLLEKMHHRNVGELEKCSKCKYAFLCKGGCLTIAAKEGKEISSIQCNDYDVTFKAVVNKIYSKHISNMDICQNKKD